MGVNFRSTAHSDALIPDDLGKWMLKYKERTNNAVCNKVSQASFPIAVARLARGNCSGVLSLQELLLLH